MTPLQPLLTLLAHAERERNAAMAEAKRVELEQRNALRQTDQLHAYRRDYEQRWSHQFRLSGGIDILRCYQGFITRLAEAIEVQERISLGATQRLELAQTAWQAQEMRVASVRKLIERRGTEARSLDERREQQRLDEYAARLGRSRAAGAAASPT